MKKKIIILLFLYNYLTANAQIKDSIIWNENRPLTWSDFKIKKTKIENLHSAGVAVGLFAQPEYNPNTGIYKFNVYAVSYPYKSWSIKKYENKYGLLHEQLHFDITKLYALKAEEVLNNKQHISIYDAKQTYDSINNELSKMQKKYDSETIHSLISFNQKLWEIKIKNELRKYGFYKRKIDKSKCEAFHKGTFSYKLNKYNKKDFYYYFIVNRKDSVQIIKDTINNIKLKQKIKWINKCTYMVYNTEFLVADKYYPNQFPDEKIIVQLKQVKNNIYTVDYVSDKYNILMSIEIKKIR